MVLIVTQILLALEDIGLHLNIAIFVPGTVVIAHQNVGLMAGTIG